MTSRAGDKHRLRASKACQRCSRRKVKCDATQLGGPCSRCRMDNISECTLITSRRGTYDRKNFRRQDRSLSTASPPSPAVHQAGLVSPSVIGSYNQSDAYIPPQPLTREDRPNCAHTVDQSTDYQAGEADAGHTARPPGSVPSTTSVDSAGNRSLSSMFEDFLGQAGHEELCKAKLVLFGEPSPLTFALQLRRDLNSGLHDTSQRLINSDTLAVVEEDIHPKHMAQHDIDCLKAKGAFIYPDPGVLDEMITVFLTRFYPLYSVVSPLDLRKAQQERKLPWILLQSICFIAMTFCEPTLIYKAGFSSRAQGRQLYYNRAKALFDLNYENSKIILVKVAILLSFKGPQMDCYWNPCSWIELGVTMAVALGMHRKSVMNNGRSDDPGLLRRIWWTLAVRDAHCSALLGRPFRINTTQCDIDMLTMDDFPDEHTCSSSASPSSCTCREAFEYQIHIAKLSLILRDIVHFRFGPTSGATTIDHLQSQLASWKCQLPPTMQCVSGQPSISKSAVHLDILLNYHMMLLHMDQPSSTSPCASGGYDFASSTESSALAISSSAIKLVTRASIYSLPHEVFPGFFVAGIILYQQAQQAQNLYLARMIRASFDNCQMLLNEAQNTWDPGVWALKAFEFLLSATEATDATTAAAQMPLADGPGVRAEDMSSADVLCDLPAQQPQTPGYPFVANGAWPGAPPVGLDQNMAMDMAEYILLPNFFNSQFGS